MATVNITAEDYLSAQMLHTQLTWKQAIWFSAIILLALAAYFWFPNGSSRYIVVGGLVGGVIGGLGARLIIRYLVLPFRSKKLYAQQKGIHGDIEYTWDDHALTIKTPRAQGAIPWADYVKWRENDRLFLLYQNDILFNMILKRMFVDAAELQAFRDRFVSKIPPAK